MWVGLRERLKCEKERGSRLGLESLHCPRGWCEVLGAGGGRETSLEVVRKDEGVGQQEKRRGEAVMKENCQALVTD